MKGRVLRAGVLQADLPAPSLPLRTVSEEGGSNFLLLLNQWKNYVEGPFPGPWTPMGAWGSLGFRGGRPVCRKCNWASASSVQPRDRSLERHVLVPTRPWAPCRSAHPVAAVCPPCDLVLVEGVPVWGPSWLGISHPAADAHHYSWRIPSTQLSPAFL